MIKTSMTVKQLIKLLKKQDPKRDVRIGKLGEYCNIVEVWDGCDEGMDCVVLEGCPDCLKIVEIGN